MITYFCLQQLQFYLCFRLLNSEIGNDPYPPIKVIDRITSFRLLNSEIGNDQSLREEIRYGRPEVFVSLTRR